MSKRGAAVQITKDDYDDEDRYGPPIIPGTWQKADESVLAQRKIRKAKRPTPAAEGGSLPLPPANPFAGVELSAAEPAANPFANVQLTAAAANPFANLELVPAKAQKSSAQSNPFASVQLFAPPAAAPAADPDLALRERMQCVRRARLAML